MAAARSGSSPSTRTRRPRSLNRSSRVWGPPEQRPRAPRAHHHDPNTGPRRGPLPIFLARLDKYSRRLDTPGMLVPVARARQILLVVGICVAAIGAMALPFPRASPKALTQSFFERVAMTGAFTRPGLILLGVGLGCLALAALMPSGRQ